MSAARLETAPIGNSPGPNRARSDRRPVTRHGPATWRSGASHRDWIRVRASAATRFCLSSSAPPSSRPWRRASPWGSSPASCRFPTVESCHPHTETTPLGSACRCRARSVMGLTRHTESRPAKTPGHKPRPTFSAPTRGFASRVRRCCLQSSDYRTWGLMIICRLDPARWYWHSR